MAILPADGDARPPQLPTARAISVAGGQISTSQAAAWPRQRCADGSISRERRASPFIFQFPAISCRMLLLPIWESLPCRSRGPLPIIRRLSPPMPGFRHASRDAQIREVLGLPPSSWGCWRSASASGASPTSSSGKTDTTCRHRRRRQDPARDLSARIPELHAQAWASRRARDHARAGARDGLGQADAAADGQPPGARQYRGPGWGCTVATQPSAAQVTRHPRPSPGRSAPSTTTRSCSAIQQSGFTEQSFIDVVRGDTARDQLLAATQTASQMPAGYAQALFAYLNEERAARICDAAGRVRRRIAPTHRRAACGLCEGASGEIQHAGISRSRPMPSPRPTM